MPIKLSKSLLLGLLISIMASVILLLQPELPILPEPNINKTVIRTEKNNDMDLDIVQTFTTENNWMRMIEPDPVLEKNVVMRDSIQITEPIEIKKIPQPTLPLVVETQQSVAPTPQYAYVGRLIDGHNESLFLLSPSGAITVKQGEILQGEWQVNQATETSLDLTYLPLNTTYRLMLK